MVTVNGIGWIDKGQYSCVRRGDVASYDEQAFPRKEIFPLPFRNFGRLDNVSKLTCAGVALALKDAGIECPAGRKHDIGIISAAISGCFETDMLYFRDYIESGRTLARGNLFIYTLPSSPSGEAAIYFGLQGPLLYTAGREMPAITALRAASDMILGRGASMMLAGMSEADSAVYFVLADASGGDGDVWCMLDHAVTILEKGLSLKSMIGEFSDIKKGSRVQ